MPETTVVILAGFAAAVFFTGRFCLRFTSHQYEQLRQDDIEMSRRARRSLERKALKEKRQAEAKKVALPNAAKAAASLQAMMNEAKKS